MASTTGNSRKVVCTGSYTKLTNLFSTNMVRSMSCHLQRTDLAVHFHQHLRMTYTITVVFEYNPLASSAGQWVNDGSGI